MGLACSRITASIHWILKLRKIINCQLTLMGRVSTTTRKGRLRYRWRIWTSWSWERLEKCLRAWTLTCQNHRATSIHLRRLPCTTTWGISVPKLLRSTNHDLKSRSSIKTLKSPSAIGSLAKNAKSNSPATRKWTIFTFNFVISLILLLLRFHSSNKLWNTQVRGNLNSAANVHLAELQKLALAPTRILQR